MLKNESFMIQKKNYKKIGLASLVFASLMSFSGLKTATVQADQVQTPAISLSHGKKLNLTAATQSLSALTESMNDTVSDVAKQNASSTDKKTSNSTQKSAAASKLSASQKIVNTAKQYLGVPYVWGCATPDGFDCSGLTSYVYRKALGKEIGRTAYNQMANGKSIPVSQAKVGDVLVFFGGEHVGIYLGDGQFIHPPKPGDSVKISSLADMPADYALEF